MKIWRKGATARQWVPVFSKGKLSARRGQYVTEAFWMPSKGGGVTEVMVRHYPDDFRNQIKAMGIANEAALLSAFGEWLVARTVPAAQPPVGQQPASATTPQVAVAVSA